jgi:hypothetical protein
MGAPYNIKDVSEDALHLKDMMDGVLERVQSVYQSYNVPLPSRCYWIMGTPAIDCEQLVVSFNQLYLGPPGDQANTPQRCNMPRTATLEILISREVVTVGQGGRAPSGDKIQEASVPSAVDAWVLMESINLFDQWDGSGGFGLGVIATVESMGPEGGFSSVSMQLTMAVP